MKCIILCAGYATRLYPLTVDTPKHLLKVKDRTILDYVLEKIPLSEIDDIYIVTNNKFYSNFVTWRESLNDYYPITILNDYTTSNDDRLGSIGDVEYVFQKMGIDDDFILMSGDNLFNFQIEPIFDIFKDGKNIIALHDVKSIAEARKMGIPEINSEGIIISLEEKPQHPKSTLVSIGIYLFQRSVIKLLRQYLVEGNSPDKVGDFIAWLCQRTDIYTYNFDGPDDIWMDIGTTSQLMLAEKIFHEDLQIYS